MQNSAYIASPFLGDFRMSKIFNTVYIKFGEVVIGCEHDLHSHYI